MEVGACLGAEVGNHVIAAVDVGQSLVEAYVKHCELVVVAEEALEESLVRQRESGKVVVRAVDEDQVRAVVDGEGGKVVV